MVILTFASSHKILKGTQACCSVQRKSGVGWWFRVFRVFGYLVQYRNVDGSSNAVW